MCAALASACFLLLGGAWRTTHAQQTRSPFDAVGLQLVAMPPYSPKLKPAERLFEEVCHHVAGRTYTPPDDKVAVVQTFLLELAADPAHVRRLCGWDWLTDALDTLPTPLEYAA